MIYVKYDPTQEFHKSIVGAVPEGVRFGIRLQINRCVAPSKVVLVVYGDNGGEREFTMYKDLSGAGFDNYIADVQFKKGLYWYYFRMEGVAYERYIGIDDSKKAALFYRDVRPWQLSVYKKQYKTPDWLNRGVMYQIMVDRFCHEGEYVVTEDKLLRPWGEQPFYREENGVVKNRDFFGGNLQGIISKLPYLASLNVKNDIPQPRVQGVQQSQVRHRGLRGDRSHVRQQRGFCSVVPRGGKAGHKDYSGRRVQPRRQQLQVLQSQQKVRRRGRV